jgi:hypothetical protein
MQCHNFKILLWPPFCIKVFTESTNRTPYELDKKIVISKTQPTGHISYVNVSCDWTDILKPIICLDGYPETYVSVLLPKCGQFNAPIYGTPYGSYLPTEISPPPHYPSSVYICITTCSMLQTILCSSHFNPLAHTQEMP